MNFNVIIVIEKEENIHSKEIASLLNKSDRYYILINGKLRDNCTNEPSNKIIKIITLTDIDSILNELERQTKIDSHFQYGLPTTIDRNGTLSLVMLNETVPERRIKYHSFRPYYGSKTR
jgi:hypothetical protein